MSQPAADVMYPRVVSELRGSALTNAEIGTLTGVSERQVQRWASGSSRPEGDSRARLLELKYVVDHLRDVYTEDGVEIWLHGRNRGLGGQRPIDLLEAGQFDVVLEAIERLHTGAM
ncbi:DUF2384 domain-containing protein [Georgenia sp. TF02-10]|uniref:antitoxin Xre/MbcA/ParS toxin-binding domain-containing protein n=1 Tax=Georgenia sp. TF02-10 TaxID=2917725 RepID=UPI001FA80E7E|nr:antitoxin Xre/MbcA/ParS toxin-binding domain-containing protein [Georgenia sp. TF02-10]UNX53437.1 DUF2384 domain-containing protein [Georgenia sp. TF02-10]